MHSRFNSRNCANQTPLYMALLHLHSDVIDLLFSVGAILTLDDVTMYREFEASEKIQF